MSVGGAVNNVPPDMMWNELLSTTSQEARSIGTKVDFSIIAADKRICEPA